MVVFYHRSSSSSLHKNIIFFFITFPFTIILYPLGSNRITIMYSFFIYSKGVFNFLYFISSKKYYQTAPVILKRDHSKDLSRSKLHSNPIKYFLFVTKKLLKPIQCVHSKNSILSLMHCYSLIKMFTSALLTHCNCNRFA